MSSQPKVLITGGTGSWGHELAKQLKARFHDVTIMARNESKLVEMQRNFPEYNYLIGDVRDYRAVEDAMEDKTVIYHLAAIKHVPICEKQPHEAIETNIRGSENIVKAAKKLNKKRVILVSTDKAVEPINTYGISKAMAEKIFLSAGYKVIRAGNVIGTAGSAIPLFKKQIEAGQPVTITDTDMTRFFITLQEAIGLVIYADLMCKNGEIAILDMPSYYLMDIVYVLTGCNKNYPINVIGIRPGEKLHEILVSEGELPNTYDTGDGILIVTKSPRPSWKRLYSPLSSRECSGDLTEITEILTEAGYI